MVKYFIFAMCTGFVVCFQNCTDKEFSVRTDLSKSTSLDGSEQLIADDTTNSDSDIDDIINGGDGSSASNGGGSAGSSTGSSAGGGDSSSGNMTAGNIADDDDDDGNDNDYDDTDDADDDTDEVAEVGEVDKEGKICMRHGVKMKATDVGVCILEGPGKSQRVALINDQIVSNNSTPKSVCMTALACRRIVDDKFTVVSLEKRGFCKNNSAHSILLTDAQVRTLIDQIQ